MSNTSSVGLISVEEKSVSSMESTDDNPKELDKQELEVSPKSSDIVS